MDLQEFVITKRKENSWNQEQLANRAEVTRMTIYRIEARENVNYKTVVAVLAALGYALEPVKIEGWEP